MSRLQLQHILGSSTARSQQMAFAQDCLLYVSGSHIILYNPIVDEQITYLKHNSPLISCIAVSPCEQYLAVCSSPHLNKQSTLDNHSKRLSSITVYKLGEVGLTEFTVTGAIRGHKYAVDHAVFSPDSRFLVTVCNQDGSLFIWDCSSGERLTQNKNSKNINCIKFVSEKPIQVGKNSEAPQASLVTCGRGNCKVWPFYSREVAGAVGRVNQEEHWILVGRTVPLNKKFATKQFIDISFWQTYMFLLTTDGLLCMVSRTEGEQKLEKCIDLMITRTSSMDIYHNTIMCGGDNALIKVIDLDTLTLVRKFPKPPPTNKENISKDAQEEEVLADYQESEEFPRCTGIRTIGSSKFSQFIVTLYENLTMFIWRPEPQDIFAMRSIITHRASIKSVKILQEFKNDLTFFSTISEDNTLRIWHIYQKCFYNRESIDIASLVGIKRNAYCRNLTRIIYMESEKQVTGIAGFCRKSIACIAQREFIIYSLATFEVICHQLLQFDAVALQIRDSVAYVGLETGKVILFQVLLEEDRLNKIREVEFDNKIKRMLIINDQASRSPETILLVETAATQQVILYSLKKSKVIHVEKNVSCCSAAGHNIVLCKTDQSISIYNLAKGKASTLLSLKHEMEGELDSIANVACNLLWVAVTTSRNKLIVVSYSQAVACTEQFHQPLNDMALSDGGEVILVGDFGNIMIYRVQAGPGYTGMEEQVKKWMEKNDMSWLEGSVFANKKSIDASKMLGSVVDSVRLRSSADYADNRGSVRLVQDLPSQDIKYKSNVNQQSVFNPADILRQAKNIYNQIDVMEKKNTSGVAQPQMASKQAEDDGLEQIILQRNKNKLPTAAQQQSKGTNSKKRIFGIGVTNSSKSPPAVQYLTKKVEPDNQEGKAQRMGTLVESVIHPSQQLSLELTPSSVQGGAKGSRSPRGNFSDFMEFQNNSAAQKQQVRDDGELTQLLSPEAQKQGSSQIISMLEKIEDKKFVEAHLKDLQKLYSRLGEVFDQKQSVGRKAAASQFNKLAEAYLKFLNQS